MSILEMVREWVNLLRGVKRLLGWRCRSSLRLQLGNQETCAIATPTQCTTHSDGSPGDQPPVVRPPFKFLHADTLSGAKVRVSEASGWCPSALCGRCVLHIRSLCLTLVLQMPRFIVLTCGLLDRLAWMEPMQGVLVQVIWFH